MTSLDELKRLFKENILIEFTDKSLICTGQIPTKPILELIDSYEQLQRRFEEAVEVIKFYSNGGNSNRDIWFDEELGYFTGKRAIEFLRSLDKEK